jgi:hypothetical protein
MIYSPDHKFLLLKGLKVGSTSMEIALSRVVPDNSIVTPIKPYHVEHRPRNYKGFENRMSYTEISEKIDLSGVKSYIAIRNPYDVVLSRFFHAFTINYPKISWDSLGTEDQQRIIDNFFEKDMMKSTKNLYLDNSLSIQVDKFIRYEDGIEIELNKILSDHGIPNILINTNEKAHRPKHITYKDVFSINHIEKIQAEWYWEFDNFGYER